MCMIRFRKQARLDIRYSHKSGNSMLGVQKGPPKKTLHWEDWLHPCYGISPKRKV